MEDPNIENNKTVKREFLITREKDKIIIEILSEGNSNGKIKLKDTNHLELTWDSTMLKKRNFTTSDTPSNNQPVSLLKCEKFQENDHSKTWSLKSEDKSKEFNNDENSITSTI
ncbi:hypothetical protein [Chryseobacterium vrystaatense]|uniref:hypothetical protein n=1 Tax=Chryseobacterium vrystaatense TaxID=307480 RepID=UPI00103CF4DC|nr:hypothetical protein [Chryseobacterium vrystaatense]